jgi:hypothetical protein
MYKNGNNEQDGYEYCSHVRLHEQVLLKRDKQEPS